MIDKIHDYSAQELNVNYLHKDNDRYIFVYDDAHAKDILVKLGNYAANPDLNFTWYDAAVLSGQIRAQQTKLKKSSRFSQ